MQYTAYMIAGRKTHDYPHGKPFPLILVNIGMGLVCVLWVMLAQGSWARAIGIITIFVALAFIDSRVHRRYERAGQAVPIPRPIGGVKLVNGLPAPLLALRCAFFVLVAILIIFGVAPVKEASAKIGMIGSVIGLAAVGILHVAIEQYYVHKGRSEEVVE